MRTNWETYPIELKGGLMTHLSNLQQGMNAPGSAAVLTNFEPSVDGGYKKVLGYEKWSANALAGSGEVQGVISVNEEDAIGIRGGKYYLSVSAGAWVEKLDSSLDPGGKIRHTVYNFNGTEKIMMVNGATKPVIFDSVAETIAIDSGAPSDADGASYVLEYKNHIFLGNGTNLVFTAPYTDTDYTPANGAGVINVGDTIVGLVSFRDQLIIFCKDRIHLLAGSSQGDFVLQPVTTKTGCINGDTIQEVGGDIMYLGPDGIRYLSATDRNEEFGNQRASENIQSLITATITAGAEYSSTVVREKSQYRIFKWNSGDKYFSIGYLATKHDDGDFAGISWSRIEGFKVYCIDSKQYADTEVILFANDDGYIYKMESTTALDGDEIRCSFRTPDLPVTDPRIRKTWYKLTTYFESDFEVNVTLQVILDSGNSRIPQPETILITNAGASTVYFWDSSTTLWDTFMWSEPVNPVVTENLIGSSKTIAFNFYESSTTSNFLIDTLLLEFRQNDRK